MLEYTGTDKNVVIPAKFDELLPYAFYNNKTMETLDLGTNLKVIGNFSFFGCTSLNAIYIPSNIEEIGISAFQGCYSVETLTFQDSSKLKTIGKYGFAGLALVESIVLPHGLELADSYCFMGCSNLTEFIMPGTLKRLSYKMIHGCDKLEIAYFNGIGFGEMAMEKDPETGHLYFFYWYYKSGLKWVITEGGAWEVEPTEGEGENAKTVYTATTDAKGDAYFYGITNGDAALTDNFLVELTQMRVPVPSAQPSIHPTPHFATPLPRISLDIFLQRFSITHRPRNPDSPGFSRKLAH